MKSKLLFAVLAVCAIACAPIVATAQTEAPPGKFDYGVFYDSKSKDTSAVALAKITRLDKLKVDISGFAGLNANTNRVAVGFAATRRFTLDPKLSLAVGLGVKVEHERPVGAGFLALFSLRFGS